MIADDARDGRNTRSSIRKKKSKGIEASGKGGRPKRKLGRKRHPIEGGEVVCFRKSRPESSNGREKPGSEIIKSKTPKNWLIGDNSRGRKCGPRSKSRKVITTGYRGTISPSVARQGGVTQEKKFPGPKCGIRGKTQHRGTHGSLSERGVECNGGQCIWYERIVRVRGKSSS